MMKCLILTKASARNTSDGNILRSAIASLHSHGIRYERQILENLSASAIANLSNKYDFVLIPELSAGFGGFLSDTTMTLPVIGLSCTTGPGNLGAYPGVSSIIPGAPVDRWLNVTWSKATFIASYTHRHVLSDGVPIATIAATDALIGGAQADAGYVVAWSTQLAGGRRMYVSDVRGNIQPWFAIMLQTAINEGEIIPNIPRKAPFCFDIDHINGEYAHAYPEIIDYLASKIPMGGMIWGGISNANTTIFENMSPVVASALKKYHDAGKFKFCYHSHRNFGAEWPTTGKWPYTNRGGTLADQITKSQQDNLYKSDRAVMQSHGLDFDYPAHNNAGGNSWNEATLELYSEDTSVTSDALNVSSITGYGYRTGRVGEGRHCSRAYPSELNSEFYYNQWYQRRVIRGQQLLLTDDLALNGLMPYDTIAKWRNAFRYILQAIAFGQHLYMHDQDFIPTDQQPGVAGKQHGHEMLTIITDLCAYLKDCVVPFANPVDFVMPRHTQGVNGIHA